MTFAAAAIFLVAAVLLTRAAWLHFRSEPPPPARHVAPAERRRVFERTEKPAGDKAQREAAYDELRPQPAPGETIYTDHTVCLPWTPPADLAPFPPPPAWAPSTAELDEMKERFLAAQGKPPIVLGPIAVAIEAPGEDGEDWAESGVHEWHDHAPLKYGDEGVTGCPACERRWECPPEPAERLATDTDVRTVTCAAPARPASTPPDDVADVLPAWIREALNGHDGVDACLNSIVARAAGQ